MEEAHLEKNTVLRRHNTEQIAKAYGGRDRYGVGIVAEEGSSRTPVPGVPAYWLCARDDFTRPGVIIYKVEAPPMRPDRRPEQAPADQVDALAVCGVTALVRGVVVVHDGHVEPVQRV